jgi:hypothetical protein
MFNTIFMHAHNNGNSKSAYYLYIYIYIQIVQCLPLLDAKCNLLGYRRHHSICYTYLFTTPLAAEVCVLLVDVA